MLTPLDENEIPSSFREKLKQKQIRNPKPSLLNLLFPLSEFPFISLPDFPLYMIGYRGTQKVVFQLKVLEGSGGDKPLIGYHKIEVQNRIYEVESLTSFRKLECGITDFLSFDRSTFLLKKHEGQHYYIRLSSIRHRLYIPISKSYVATEEIEEPSLKRQKTFEYNEEVDSIIGHPYDIQSLTPTTSVHGFWDELIVSNDDHNY